MCVICGRKGGEYEKLLAFQGAAPFIQQCSVPHFLQHEVGRARFLVLNMWLKQLAEFCDGVNSLTPFQDTKNPDAEHSAAYLGAKYC